MARADAHALSLDQGFRMMLYLLGPNETSFARDEDVPEYVEKATPFFMMLMLSELLIGWAKTGSLVIRINDGITSLSAGVMSRLSK
ncbi:hypothetical protein Z043_109005 [Scleropages formosus]|uniref:Uncharacterized protein n=1 Tax=Scleropages formosus TaxID=113540 RepID=A0A0P7X5D1_SCLFO|nr:hypothetical protein Z043_109005 [Scleropages formosus]